MIQTEYVVYRWEDHGDGSELRFERRLFVRHEIGEQVTKERLRQAVEDEVYDFKPTKYRIVPFESMVDIEIIGAVVLS